MKLNDEILSSLRRAIEHYGNTSQFADHIGVAHSTILFWLSGKTTNISSRIWNNCLRRELRPFMKEVQGRNHMVREDGCLVSGVKQASPRRDVCLGKFSEMLQFDSTVESPVSFIESRSSKTVVFSCERLDSFFALELDMPVKGCFLPLGARLLLSRSDYAQDGDVVVGKFRDPLSLFLCRYQREGSMIRLYPLYGTDRIMEWNVEVNAEKIFWIYPVEEILIDLLKFRWEKEGLVPRQGIVRE